jgi:4,5-dihydroxyphthalate decarboxylase
MAKLQLSLMMSSNARSQPVLDGSISPDGIELTCTVGHPSEIFWRQLQFREFDLSEMSLSSLLIAIAGGNTDWVGLPIFPRRRCGRSGGWVRAERGIEGPADLAGKRVGVPEYQQTAALWSRGILHDEFGLDPRSVELGLLEAGPLGVDPYPYGVKSNQKVLETIARYSYAQGLTPRLVGLDEVFAPSTLELSRM